MKTAILIASMWGQCFETEQAAVDFVHEYCTEQGTGQLCTLSYNEVETCAVRACHAVQDTWGGGTGVSDMSKGGDE